ncbi:MAG: hypothetical protein ACREOJ_15900 [Gemmatimonadaceae bacterium]
MQWRRVIGSTACLALVCCHHARPAAIDLSCDQIIYTAAEDSNRFALRTGSAANDDLRRADRGELVVRTHPIVASERLEPPFRVTLTRAGAVAAEGSALSDSTYLLADSAGSYGVSVRCMHCGHADNAVILSAGRTDTLDVFLTRFPDNCEAKRRK